jgi:hypothetical protein
MRNFLLFSPPSPVALSRNRAGATPLSGRASGPGGDFRLTREIARLARGSLPLGLIVALAPACLVLSTPDDVPPVEKTPPFLIADRATPNLRELIDIDLGATLPDDFGPELFSAFVVSEDDGDDVDVYLFIDYGFPDNPDGFPFLKKVNQVTVPASTLSDRTRQVTFSQNIAKSLQFLGGCHNVTMIATHDFAGNDCPRCMTDSSQLTWQVRVCSSNQAMADLPPCQVLDREEDCLHWNYTNSCPPQSGPDTDQVCPAYEAEKADAGAGAP